MHKRVARSKNGIHTYHLRSVYIPLEEQIRERAFIDRSKRRCGQCERCLLFVATGGIDREDASREARPQQTLALPSLQVTNTNRRATKRREDIRRRQTDANEDTLLISTDAIDGVMNYDLRHIRHARSKSSGGNLSIRTITRLNRGFCY